MIVAFQITAGHIVAAVVGGLLTLFLERLVTKGRAGVTCPSCGADLPSHRKPASVRQALLGGWTCSCGAELDRKARLRDG